MTEPIRRLAAKLGAGPAPGLGFELLIPLVTDILVNYLKTCFPDQPASLSAKKYVVGYNRTARTLTQKAYRDACKANGYKPTSGEVATFANNYLAEACQCNEEELKTTLDDDPEVIDKLKGLI